MNYFGVLVVCVVCYGVSGFPDDFMDDDKLVIPLKPSAKTKPIEIPRHKMNMKFHQLRNTKPGSGLVAEEPSNYDITQSQLSKVQFSASSSSSRIVSSNGNSQVTEESSKSHTNFTSDGTTQLNQTEYIAQAKENKTMNGCTENRESVAAMKAVEVANKNPDGSVHTFGTAVAKSAVSQTADGETKSQTVKAASMTETVKDAAGEERSKMIGLAQEEETKSNNGQHETSKTLAAGESEQVTHADGKSERTDKFVVLLPDSKIDKSNINDAANIGKENKKKENHNQGTSNKRINHSDQNTNKKPENSQGPSTSHKIRIGSGSLDKPFTEGNRNNAYRKSKVHKSEKETKETNKSENKEKENDAITQSYDEDSERITGEDTSDDEYKDKIAKSDDEDESDDTDSDSDTDNDDQDSVNTHRPDYTSTDNQNNKNDDSGVMDPKADPTETEAYSEPYQNKRVRELTVTQSGSTQSQ